MHVTLKAFVALVAVTVPSGCTYPGNDVDGQFVHHGTNEVRQSGRQRTSETHMQTTVPSELAEMVRAAPVREVGFHFRGVRLTDDIRTETENFAFCLNDERPWLVIAVDNSLGDPLLVDASAPPYAVYFVTHDLDDEPEQIADSAESFLRLLAAFQALVAKHRALVSDSDVPLSPAAAQAFMDSMKAANPASDPWYWEKLVGIEIDE